jgi:hypothetical protein
MTAAAATRLVRGPRCRAEPPRSVRSRDQVPDSDDKFGGGARLHRPTLGDRHSRCLLYPRLRQRTVDEGHGRRLRRVAYSPSSSLSWTCCCCWNMGRACSAAAGGGSSQPSAIRSQSSANRSRAARVCSFSVACAASKQVLARRRYSSPLPAGDRYDHCRSPIEKFDTDDGRPVEGRQDLDESAK